MTKENDQLKKENGDLKTEVSKLKDKMKEVSDACAVEVAGLKAEIEVLEGTSAKYTTLVLENASAKHQLRCYQNVIDFIYDGGWKKDQVSSYLKLNK